MAQLLNDQCAEHSRHPVPRRGNRCATCSRIRLEKKIVLRVVRDLHHDGFELGVFDGEEVTVRYTRDRDAIEAALFTTDQDRLLVRGPDGVNFNCFVEFTYGNDGFDVISDFSIGLAPYLAPIEAWIDTLEA